MMEALECITCWLMVGPPWIYQYHKTKAAVINAIMSVLHSSSKPVPLIIYSIYYYYYYYSFSVIDKLLLLIY